MATGEDGQEKGFLGWGNCLRESWNWKGCGLCEELKISHYGATQKGRRDLGNVSGCPLGVQVVSGCKSTHTWRQW